jgi:cell division protein FtsB
MREVNLDTELIDSEETMRTYLRFNMLWGKEVAVELTRIVKSIKYLREDFERLSREIDQLKA